jgi:hypothetical protein
VLLRYTDECFTTVLAWPMSPRQFFFAGADDNTKLRRMWSHAQETLPGVLPWRCSRRSVAPTFTTRETPKTFHQDQLETN